MKILAAVLCLAFSLPAAAACVTSKVASGTFNWKIVCEDGDEIAPTLVTQGLPLDGLKTITVTAAADSGQTFTATPAGKLAIYLWDPQVALWGRCYDCAEPTIKAISQRTESLGAFDVKGPAGRVMLVPVGVTLSSGGITIYVSGSR